MTFARANAVGWAFMELLLSDQMNVIDEQLPFALDGRDGGTYHPGAVLVLDGDLGTTSVLQVNNVPNASALTLSAVNGSAAGLLLLDGTVHGTWISSSGAALSLGFEPLPLLALTGHANDAEQGGPAGLFTGGEGIGASGTAGTGIKAAGGLGVAAPYRGGIGVTAEAGASDFTGAGASAAGVLAGIGVHGYGGATTGADATHWGGLGVLGVGGNLSGTGRGGFGVRGQGGLGPTASTSGADVGEGVRGEGSTGVHGVATRALNAALPSEFTFQPIVGVKGSAKNVGRSLLAEFSGNTSEGSTAAVRWVGDTGTGETAIFSVEAALQFTTIVDPDYTTLLLCSSNVDSGPIRGARIEGRGRPGASVRTVAHAGIMYPGLELVEQAKPTVNVPGGMAYIDVGSGITGQLRDTFYLSGTSRTDRIVQSADPAATFAWCRVNQDGIGAVSLGVNYGVATLDTTNVAAGNFVVELDTLADGPTDVNMMPQVSCSRQGGIAAFCTAEVVDATHVRIYVWFQDGTAVDLTANTGSIYFSMHCTAAVPAADRAGIFTP